MENTAITEAINKIDLEIYHNPHFESGDYIKGLLRTKEILKQKLPKEREQIQVAYAQGRRSFILSSEKAFWTGTDYFENTFNPHKKP